MTQLIQMPKIFQMKQQLKVSYPEIYETLQAWLNIFAKSFIQIDTEYGPTNQDPLKAQDGPNSPFEAPAQSKLSLYVYEALLALLLEIFIKIDKLTFVDPS